MISVLFLLGCLALPGWSESVFDQARNAYDQGNFDQALGLYQSIDGQSPALDYNTGNTLMRLGRAPEAIAYYRRALWQKHSDPDIRANLDRAVQQTQAIIPPLPLTLRLAGFLDTHHWQWALIASCWLFAGFGLLQGRMSSLRSLSPWVFPLSALCILLSIAGLWATRPSQWMQEAVVLPETINTRFEPLPDATEHFSIPGGSVVKIQSQSRNWLRIAAAEKSGWVEADKLIGLKDLP